MTHVQAVSETHYRLCKFLLQNLRKINLKLCDRSICYLITDESKIDIADLIPKMGEYIRVDNMDCVWDFIYEVGS